MPLGQQQGFLGRLGQGVQNLLGNPAFQLGTNLMAQSGYSSTPRTFAQQLAGGLRQTGEDIMQRKQQEMQEKQFQQQLSEYEKKIKAQEAASKAREKFAELAADPNISKGELARMAVGAPDDEIRKWGIGQIFPEQKSLPEIAKIQQAYEQGLIPEDVYKGEIAKRQHIRADTPLVQIGMGGLGQMGGQDVLKLGSVPAGTAMVRTPEGGYAFEPIPGAPKTPEQAAKISGVKEAIKNVDEALDLAFDPGGDLNWGTVAGASAGLPVGDMKKLRLNILNATEAWLRAESGAAVTSDEVKRASERFMPSPMDSGEIVKQKLDSLKSRLSGTLTQAGEKVEGAPKINPERVGQAIQLLKGQPGAAAELKELLDEGVIPPAEYEAILKGLR